MQVRSLNLIGHFIAVADNCACVQTSECDHLSIKEDNIANPLVVCGAQQTSAEFQSIGRSVTVTFVYSRSYSLAFLLSYASFGKEIVPMTAAFPRIHSINCIPPPHPVLLFLQLILL